ncbi:MAG: hypothetical protein CMN76_21360 [Spirochaetaceae bacterium]|nr:hypothetical protein [Spirochaetaceae bacterium]|tara:strand:+ start:25226 stop:26968 length:1743 start_codon:yes stop_codon:yes gene_type:complete
MRFPRIHTSLNLISLLTTAIMILFLFHSMAGILDLKMIQLQQSVERERIMNLELSSRALQTRMSGMRKGDGALSLELNRNMLESRVLNPEDPQSELGRELPLASLVVTNGVRLLTFKEPLQLETDHQKLMALKLAFYFERSRRYREALRIYSRLNASDFPEPFPAFLKLHTGYCYLAQGRWQEARFRLQSVLEDHPATHFERAARHLLELMDSLDSAQARSIKEPALRADQFFEMGNCPQAISAFRESADRGPLSPRQKFRLALCLEETGQREPATEILSNLARGGGAFSTEANRRLLMIGHFYGGRSEVLQEAQIRARLQGDGFLGEIQSMATKTRKPRVVEEIQQWQKESPEPGMLIEVLSDPDPELRRELKSLDIQPLSFTSENSLPAFGNPPDGANDSRSPETAEPDQTDPSAENDDVASEGDIPGHQTEKPQAVADPGVTEGEDDKSHNPPRDSAEGEKLAILERLMSGPARENTARYEISRPSVQRWPLTLRADGESVQALLLTQKTRGRFETPDGKEFALDRWEIAAHPRGRVLLRLRDNRNFLVKSIQIQGNRIVADGLTIPADLVYQIAAY